jgi:hypothetical protein
MVDDDVGETMNRTQRHREASANRPTPEAAFDMATAIFFDCHQREDLDAAMLSRVYFRLDLAKEILRVYDNGSTAGSAYFTDGLLDLLQDAVAEMRPDLLPD